MTRITTLLLLLAFTLHLPAQEWELVTPVKTKSELPAVQMTGPTTGYIIDRVLGFVLKTTDAGDSWTRFPFNMLDKPRALWMWDDDRGIIAANSGRFYYTTDGWNTITNTLNITYGNMASVYFVDDLEGWAGSESGKIVHTTNGGATWTLQTSGTTNAVLAIHFVDDQQGYAAATGGVLLRTLDGGATWAPMTAPNPVSVRGWHFFNAQTGIGVGSAGQIIRTTDGGDTWTAITSPTTQTLLGLHVQGNTAMAMGTVGALLRSTDAGLTWSLQTLDPLDLYGAWLTPGGLGLLVGKGRVYRTTNMGAAWVPVQIGTWHTYLNKVSFGTEQLGASAGWQTSGGIESGVMRTFDGGRHWQNTFSGAGDWLGIHLRADGTGWMGGSQGANRHTTDYFATSTNHPGPPVAIRCAWAFSPTTAIVGGGYINGGCYRTTNAGSTWDHTSLGNIFDLFFVNDQLGFCAGEGGSLHKTTDGGITWQQLPTPSFTDFNCVYFLNNMVGFLGGVSSSWRTTDGGQNWTLQGDLPQYIMGIQFTGPDTGYAVSVNGYGMRTTDGGDSWQLAVTEPFDVLIGDAAFVDGALIAVGEHGDVFRAQFGCPQVAAVPTVLQNGNLLCVGEQAAQQWFLDGQPLSGAVQPCFEPTEAGSYTVVVTNALGCVSAPSAPVQLIPTSVQETGAQAPRVFPNPTTGNVTLTFPDARNRVVQVCDTQGRVVHQLRSAGIHLAVDLQGLPAGLYLVRGTTDNWTVRVVRE